jgi:hypothetical protein
MDPRRIIAIAIGCAGVVLLWTPPVMAQDTPCSQCGPGAHWVDDCAAGQDQIANHGAVVGIDLDLDPNCTEDVSLVLTPCGANLLIIGRSGPRDDSVNFPGLRPVDGHLDVIDTEIVQLCLTGGGVTLIAGAGLGQGGVLSPSLGAIAELGADNTKAESFFDVFFEVDLGGGLFAYNQSPMRIAVGPSGITCVPPQASYIHPTGCLPLYDSSIPGQGMLMANLVTAQHNVYPLPIPTVSEWGLIVMTLLLLTAGMVVFGRRRRPAASTPTAR